MSAEAGSADALFGGQVRLEQPQRGHRIGTDTVLLTALAAGLPGERLLDLGAGVGGVGISLAVMQSERFCVLVEREEELAELALRNAALNGVEERVSVLASDISGLRALGLRAGAFDLVVCNPPFHDAARHRASPDALREGAHLMPAPEIHAWAAVAAWALKPRGSFGLIYRADGLGVLLPALEKHFGGIEVRPVHPRADQPASRVLISAVRASKTPLAILPGLVLHGEAGFTPGAEALHRGDFAALGER